MVDKLKESQMLAPFSLIKSPVSHWGTQFIDKLDFSLDDKILDLGCRDGSMTTYAALRYQNCQFTGLDISLEKLEQSPTLDNLSFVQGSLKSIGSENYFDAVVNLSYLHWVQDKRSLLQDIYTLLKPGGKGYFQFFGRHGRPKNDRFLSQVGNFPRWKDQLRGFSHHYHEVSIGEFYEDLHNAGFIIHRVEFVHYQTPFDHPDQLRRWLGTWASQPHYLPSHKRETFLHETIQQYLQFHKFKSNDPFLYGEYLLEVICEKPLEVDSKGDAFKKSTLTPREQEVLELYLQGRSSKESARVLSVSPKTIEFHLGNVKKKWNCLSRYDIVQAAKRRI